MHCCFRSYFREDAGKLLHRDGGARLDEGHDSVMVAVNPPRLDYATLRVATAKLKLVAADDYGVMTARTLDISFKD